MINVTNKYERYKGFTCIAKNEAGTIKKTVKLTVDGKFYKTDVCFMVSFNTVNRILIYYSMFIFQTACKCKFD